MRFRGRPDEAEARRAMVERQIRGRGIRDERVLEALRTVPRQLFVPDVERDAACADCALPIGYGATISQPYIVALMTAALEIDRDGLRVLEIGTGSGYQAAVLAECGCDVWSVERVSELHARAAELLRSLGYGERVRLRLGDGSRGWPEEAPFDAVLVTAAAGAVPPALFDQVGPGGRIVAPVGSDWGQMIRRFRRRDGEWEETDIEGARFVPLIEDPRPPTG